jgi:L-ascorbate metabolism protein UlaG (beta-lactamase superfamily)
MAARRRGAPVIVRWLGHASVVLDVAGVRLLTDPLLRRHAGLLRRRGAAPEPAAWRDPDVVLISHLHHDHAELGSLELLGSVPMLTAPANAHWLRRHGVPGGTGLSEGEWWTAPGGAVRVTVVPAVHGDRPMPHRPNAASGFAVLAGGLRVWYAGDTGPHPGMARIPDVLGGPVDLALVPVGGWGPRLSGGHLDPAQAARACALVGARYAVPVHWGTLHAPVSRRLPPGWMDRAGPAFAHAARHEAPGCQVLLLAPGEAAEL